MNKGILGTAMASMLIIGAVVGMVMLANMNPSEIIQSVGQRGWNDIATAAPADPGNGKGGFQEVFIYPHAAVPGTTYAANLSEGSAYAYKNVLNAAMTGNVPYTSTFDIVYQVRYNVTQAWNTTSSAWQTSWTRCLLTCANLGIGANTAMTGVTIWSNATYLQMNFYLNNGGAGYQLYHGQNVNMTSFKMQYYG